MAQDAVASNRSTRAMWAASVTHASTQRSTECSRKYSVTAATAWLALHVSRALVCLNNGAQLNWSQSMEPLSLRNWVPIWMATMSVTGTTWSTTGKRWRIHRLPW